MKKIIGILAGVSLAALLLIMPKNEKEQQPLFYEKFEKALNELGIEIFKGVQMAAGTIGAIDGKKFMTLAGDIEIYQFEPDHLALRKAKALGKFSADGDRFFDVAVNGNYMLCVSSLPEVIVDTFLAIDTRPSSEEL